MFNQKDVRMFVLGKYYDLFSEYPLWNYDLENYSLDTVKAFYKDAVDAGFKIN